jgi:hypothetical protein
LKLFFYTKQIRKRKLKKGNDKNYNDNNTQKKKKVKFQGQVIEQNVVDINKNDDEYEDIHSDDLSTRNVFPISYHETFESICKNYGKMLSRQSDRCLPRTHFNSSYMTHTKKWS